MNLAENHSRWSHARGRRHRARQIVDQEGGPVSLIGARQHEIVHIRGAVKEAVRNRQVAGRFTSLVLEHRPRSERSRSSRAWLDVPKAMPKSKSR